MCELPLRVVEKIAVADAPAWAVWEAIARIGGPTGWYSTPRLWRLRGWMDEVIGGPGLRGRDRAVGFAVGDAVDWWRVESVAPGRVVTLRAEMRAGGHAWLQLAVTEQSRFTLRAVFIPTCTAGRVYWAAVAPFHALVFPQMVRNILSSADRIAARRG